MNVIIELLAAGAKPDLADDDGATPLSVAPNDEIKHWLDGTTKPEDAKFIPGEMVFVRSVGRMALAKVRHPAPYCPLPRPRPARPA